MWNLPGSLYGGISENVRLFQYIFRIRTLGFFRHRNCNAFRYLRSVCSIRRDFGIPSGIRSRIEKTDSPHPDKNTKTQKENGNYKKVTDTFYKFHTASHLWCQCSFFVSVSVILSKIYIRKTVLEQPERFSESTQHFTAGNIIQILSTETA